MLLPGASAREGQGSRLQTLVQHQDVCSWLEPALGSRASHDCGSKANLFGRLLANPLAPMLLCNGVEVVHSQLVLEVLPERANGLAKFSATKR